MANHDDQFQAESTPVAEALSNPSANVTTIHNPLVPETDSEQSLDTEWDSDKTEVLTESLDSSALSAWLTDPMGFDIEMTRFPFVVGRSDDCDLTPNGRGLSRRHAEVIFHSGRFVIRDLDSLNGIQVNGCKVARVILDDGDEISIGDTQFTFKHRNPANQAQSSSQESTATNANKWLKLSAFAAAALVLVVGGISAFQQYLPTNQNMTIAGDNANSNRAQEPTTVSAPPAVSVAKSQSQSQSKPAVAETTKIKASADTPKIAEANVIKPPQTTELKQNIEVAKETLQKAPAQIAKIIKKPSVKPSKVFTKTSKVAPAPSTKKQRQESIRVAKGLLKKANAEYLSGNATQIIRKLKISSLSKGLPASTKREVTKKYNLLNQLHGFYTSGNKALNRNDKDKAFAAWDKYLDRLDLNFPGEMPPYAKEVTHYMADEYAQRAKQASGTKQYQLAYQFWQKAFSLNGNPTAESQISLIEEKAHQLYRQGLRQEYVNSAKAKKLWQQVVKLVPPSSEVFTKANAKLVWYTRWEE